MKQFYTLIFLLGFFSIGNAQIINFPDATFKAKILASTVNGFIAKNLTGNYFDVDTNNDNEIDVNEALQVSYLNVSVSSITSLVGIEYFTNLIDLNCALNGMTTLNVSNLVNLKIFRCDSNKLNDLNIDGLINLTSLAYGNDGSPTSTNHLPNINLSQFTHLESLYCGFSNLTTLDISALVNLRVLVCYYNQISNLDLSNCPNFYSLNCEGNQFEYINLNNTSGNPGSIHVDNNPNLKQLLVKLGRAFSYNDFANISFSNCPNLEYICVDEFNAAGFQTKINGYGYTNCNLNSYCSFNPGGVYYTIQGDSKFDYNNDGCDTNDLVYPNLKMSITNGTNTLNFISNASGHYSIPGLNGTQTIRPILENPSYFNISPASFSVAFPAQSNPYTKNFCITANGVHNDVGVAILPITIARPGFDAKYKVVYKNKGNTIMSGNVSLSFNDDKIDFISATPVFANQTSGLLSWDYINLQPFETREIVLTFNTNSPQETPPVNIGNVLNFTATINPLEGDDFLQDNIKSLKQIVVGPIDPNHKTCIEGDTVGTDMIGAYVNYVIQFENLGTYAAENIVVKDNIDANKFDVTSLVPSRSSHPFVTKINGNVVEFIFENINLPFDDANNDGYVAFKIKTKPTLVEGNTFDNKANIYFDYNFPIETNTTSTIIQNLGNQDFEFSNYFTLYPNPVNDVLNIKTKNAVEILSASVYNVLGQLLEVIANPTESIDTSELKSGNYFIKFLTDKGTTSSMFVKN